MTLYERTIANGGGTFDPYTEEDVTSGFAVAIVHDTWRIVPVEDEAAFNEAVQEFKREWNLELGTWVHEGNIHIDPVSVQYYEAEARRIAELNNQLAYYNITDGIEVML